MRPLCANSRSPPGLKVLSFRHWARRVLKEGDMRRRELIMLLCAATAWLLAVRAERPTMPVIGFLNFRSKYKGEPVAAAFRRGLRDAGYEEGRNVAVEYRWAEDQYDRLPALAVDLVTQGGAAVGGGGGGWGGGKEEEASNP